MYLFRFFMAAVFAACLGAAAYAEEVSFCVLNDFMQIVTFKGPDTECLEFETSIELNSEGPPGPQGDPGPPGEQGPAGPQGETGPAGAKGDQGPQGETGPPGANGAPGPQGPEGKAGAGGPAGPEGDAGPAGKDGLSAFVNTAPEPPGENCPDGGIKVESGQGDTIADTTYVCDGAAGPQGETGAAGPQGDPGPPGEQGPAGPQGETGPAGAKGDQGPQGETGPPGANGAPGPQGVQGEQGPAGTNAFVNTFPEPPGENCKEGGIRIETGQNEKVIETTYVCNGAQGPEGKQGEQGSPGPEGPTGQAGPQGPEGKQGAQGSPGPQGPEGKAGSPGETGPAGPEGDEGPEGPAGITILAGGTSNNVPNNATRYLDAFTVAAVNTTEASVAHRMPVAGSLTNLNAILAGSTTGSYVFTVRVNSATPTNPVTCTISGSTSCADAANCTAVAAGDTVTIMSVTAGVNPRVVGTSMVFRAGAKCP